MVDSVSGLAPVRLDPPPPPPPQAQAPSAGVSAPPPPSPQDGGAQTQQNGSQTPGQPGGQSPGAPQDPTRVVVEQGQDKFILVLKVLNSSTGDVLAEIPNQTPQEAAANPNYHSGALLDQTV